MSPPDTTVIVHGDPGPQGSKRHVGGGRMVESSAKVKPWREAVKWAFITLGGIDRYHVPGPVRVELVFTVRKPLGAPKRRRTLPMRKPDLDKLTRSTLDALTQVTAIEDDARVVELAAAKRFPGEGEDALESPGCVIRIWRMEV